MKIMKFFMRNTFIQIVIVIIIIIIIMMIIIYLLLIIIIVINIYNSNIYQNKLGESLAGIIAVGSPKLLLGLLLLLLLSN